MELKKCGQSDADEWDATVLGADYSTVFHTWGWLSAVSKHWRGKFHAVMGLDKGVPSALMPLFVQKRMGLTLLFSPAPKTATPYLGPLFKGYLRLKQNQRETMLMDFQRSLEGYITDEIRPDYVFFLTPPGFTDIRPWQWGGYKVSPLYEYVLNPTVGADTLWGNLKRNVRNEIKQTAKAGVQVRVGGRKDYAGLIEDTKKRYKAQGINEDTSDALLMELFDSLYPGNIQVLVAEHGGERVAGIVELLYNNTVISWLGGVKSDAKGIFPNALVHWESLKRAHETGAKNYVEIGANTRHLCRFKRQFNHAPLQYFSMRSYPNPLLSVVEKGYLNVYKPLKSSFASLSVPAPGGDGDDD